MYPYEPIPVVDQLELSRRAAERHAQLDALRKPREPHLRTVRVRLARWIAPAGLEPVV
ncbi:hypothetical protein [Desertihabitans aurantiacus]|uniref:hypothetical protein n=1 Tax=Desertihabitans aurantiacus TaxID=2282477 RepID=UPI001300914C|nr:hypothetical protein [Desertihabitans aurantiacus]